MHDLAAMQKLITSELSAIPMPEYPANLYEPVSYMLQIGGKRIRPLLTLLGADMFSVADLNKAVPAAMAIELFHNFTLMHDDIMDKAPLRRGRQTVHEKWDANTAILSGDLLLILAYQQLARCESTKLASLLATFNRMAVEVCEGQQLDMDFEQRTQVTIDEYINMIKLKTSVLLGAALKIGALLGNANGHDAKCIYEFGVNVGIAFQLQDDILDVFGDPEQFGKKVGGDIIANKKTYLLIKAFELADEKTKETLSHWLASPHHDADRKVEEVTAVYRKLNVQGHAEEAKRDFSDKAFNALDRIGVDISNKLSLQALAQNLLVREN